MRRVSALLCLGFAVASASVVLVDRAHADSVTLTFDQALGNGLTVNTPTKVFTPAAPSGAYSFSTVTGPYQYTVSNSTNPVALPDTTYYGFCIQFNQDVTQSGPLSQGTFTVETLAQDLGQTTADQILYLINQYSASTPSGHPTGLDASNPTGNPQVYNDALTIAIWDVLQANANNGSSLKLSNSIPNPNIAAANGNLGVSFSDNSLNGTGSGTAVGIANGWLANLSYNTNITSGLYDANKVVAFSNPSIQDQSVILGIEYPFTPVPEPQRIVGLVGLGLMGSLIGGVLLRRRNRDMGASAGQRC